MSFFDSLLANIEEDRGNHVKAAINSFSRLQPQEVVPHAAAGRCRATAVYEVQSTLETGDLSLKQRRPPVDHVTCGMVEKAIKAALRTTHPAEELGKLRRQLASQLHPDRGANLEAIQMLARANAAIDAALKQ